MRSNAVWVFLCFCGAVALAQLNDLIEGDICKQDSSALWTCKKIRSCRKAGEALKKGQYPETCSSSGVKNTVACCEPDVSSPPRGVKSKMMCDKYAKSVFLEIEDPVSGKIVRHNTCAAVEPLITAGKKADPQEYPHLALIGYGSKEKPEWLCGGSLISERFILSSAQCADVSGHGPARWVLLGAHDIQLMGNAQQETYEIIERIIHPEFKSPSAYNDISLFKLDRDVTFNEYIRPACLKINHKFPRSYIIASGWLRLGPSKLSDTPHKCNLTVISRKECGDKIQTNGEILPLGLTDPTMMCVACREHCTGDCKGDPGYPLQVRLREPYCMYDLVGVTSFGNTGEHLTPTIYTRVSHFVDWIEKVVWP